MRLAVLLFTIVSAPLTLFVAHARALPESPRVFVDTTGVAPTGRTIVVAAGGDLQAALDSAQLGDLIVLDAGATYTGNFLLPVKDGSGWITVQTNRLDALPPAGTRVTPSHAAAMPKLVTPGVEPAIRTAAGAHHYRFRGIEIVSTNTELNYGIINFDGNATYTYPAQMTTLGEVPHHLILEQCYIHGDPRANVSRAIQLNSAHTALIDSYISEIHGVAMDTQAIGGWSGPGPYKIVNNYLEAAGENIMFGGAVSTIPNVTPSDIEIRRNHITKRLSWKLDDPSYAGMPWTIKNLLELKHAQRVLIDGNLFEFHWPSAQSGFSLLMTPRNEQNSNGQWVMPWATVAHVTVTNNVFRSLAAGIAVYGRDESDRASVPGAGFLIRNNVFYDIGTPRWQAPGSFAGNLFMIVDGVTDITIQHNTATSEGSFIVTDMPNLQNRGLVYTDNIHPNGFYGVVGPGGVAAGVISTMFPGAVFTKNALIGPFPTAGGLESSAWNDVYPGNFFPNSMGAVGFVDPTNGNFSLTAGSPFRNAATDGTDVGVNMDALNAALGGTAPPPVPSPVAPSPPVVAVVAPPPPAPEPAPAPTVAEPAPDSSKESLVTAVPAAPAPAPPAEVSEPTPAGGSVASSPTHGLSLTFTGIARDAVGTGSAASKGDGVNDGTLVATLTGAAGNIIALQLQSSSGGFWDTDGASPPWFLGVAYTLDGTLLNSASAGLNVPVASGSSFVLIASDDAGRHFQPGNTFILTAMFSDGTTATAVTVVGTP
jgi:hypothetical protein